MKIAQLVSNLHDVNARSNHAIYSHAGILADAFVEKNHDVTLFASANSKTKAKLNGWPPSNISQLSLPENIRRHYTHSLISQCYNKAENFDIIHSHFTLLSSFYANLVDTPTVSSIHSPITDEIKPLMKQFKNNRYISFSHSQRQQFPELNWVANIYHGVDTDLFAYNETPGDYFLYIGRITEEKGIHYAIEAAKAAGVKLLIAGRSYATEGYWHTQLEPHIDGVNVSYVGEADLERKIELYRNAKGLLFPTQYDEVFGLVMIEAMSCGTPVIGWNKGSVPEVIQDGETGYLVSSVEEMTEAIKNIDKIDRKACRRRVEELFSVDKMVRGYLRVYERIIAEWKRELEEAK
ncbi:MAG: glycosyltransferase family 4 protein [Candidatus Magasanikbacteria bacterium]|nr:glycosyltransferase family 4 protein [Candidatus Magasanikbacteria bacterium]MCA9391411.1 glycosyltransferase family 4 protein [Candidatus Magasanikbacteria bacterium]HPF95475.1 glycosyltransferase family 4 protein [bacterium]